MHRRIPYAQMRVFEQSSHTAHLEETETYLQVVADFLRRVEMGHDDSGEPGAVPKDR
jgi:hypothetical protein